jgi:hypothetical protein
MHQASTLPSAEGSSLPDDARTPLPAASGSPPPPGSLSKVSSCRPYSPVFEQGNASGKTPMIDLSSSSNEKNFIVDTSRNAELAKKLFGNLNSDILGSPGDGKIIVLDDSDNETEAQEEKTAGIEATTAHASTDLALSAPTSTNDAPTGVKISNSDDQGPDPEADGGDNSGRSIGKP